MPEVVRIQFEITWRVDDEMLLREASTAATGDLNVRSADAIIRLLGAESRNEDFAMPGCAMTEQQMRVLD